MATYPGACFLLLLGWLSTPAHSADTSLDSSSGFAWEVHSTPSGPVYAADSYIGAVRVPARVPGDINDDLERAGSFPDLWVADNSVHRPWWVPSRQWCYELQFATADVVAGALAGSRVDLHFEGVDYNATFVLNGAELGTHQGSFLPVAFDVSSVLNWTSNGKGINTLEVILHPPEPKLIDVLYNGSTPMYGVDQCLENRIFPFWKSRLNQWDFATKLWQIGIWRGVSMHTRAAFPASGAGARVQKLPSVVSHLTPPYSVARLQMQGVVQSFDDSLMGSTVVVKFEVSCLTDSTSPGLATNVSILFRQKNVSVLVSSNATLVNPSLWFPNGYGQQHLYQLKVSVYTHSGVLLDSTTTVFGVRHLENLHNPGPSSWQYDKYGGDSGGKPCSPCVWNSSAYPYCNQSDGRAMTCTAEEALQYPDPNRWLFSINSRRIFARGGNWVPGDLAFGRIVRNRTRFRALMRMARDAGYTYMRIWGGGLIEDQQFYDYADEFGILLQQDFPLAGCGFGPQNNSFDWLSEPVAQAGGVSVLDAIKVQIPIVVRQLINHPSIVRYTFANEFYLNRTANPAEKLFEDIVRSLDPTRMTRQADPTTVGQRHGPYHFDIAGGAGYDCWGGRWPEVGSCSAVNFHDSICCNQTSGSGNHFEGLESVPPGCRYSTHDGGPGDPFEWSEFGSNAISDIQTLAYILPAASLQVNAVGDNMWAIHKAGMWLDKGLWTDTFTDGTTQPFRNIQQIVSASQWIQAEGYRFAYQAGRRRKWHRSLMASWTFDEPWPNAAHGCVVDYYGIPKHAFYTVKQSLAMLDVSLSYSDIHAVAGQRLPATVWIDSELGVSRHCIVNVSYFTPSGRFLGHEEVVHPSSTAKTAKDSGATTTFELHAETALKLRQLNFAPPLSMVGDVLMVRLALRCASKQAIALSQDTQVATNDYVFGIRSATNSTGDHGPLRPLLDVEHTTLSLGFVNNNSSALYVAAANESTSPCALYVKPVLLDNSGNQMGYVTFSRGFVTLRPGESTEIYVLSAGIGVATHACVSAWNAPMVCQKVVSQY